jgi:hypothetical protein
VATGTGCLLLYPRKINVIKIDRPFNIFRE